MILGQKTLTHRPPVLGENHISNQNYSTLLYSNLFYSNITKLFDFLTTGQILDFIKVNSLKFNQELKYLGLIELASLHVKSVGTFLL